MISYRLQIDAASDKDDIAMEGGDATKKILADLRGYLQDNLPVDGDLVSELEYSKTAKPVLLTVATRIKEKMKR